MADVSVNMGVSGIQQFKQGMTEAGAAVKTLDAALKANEKQFQKTGNAEEHYAAQTTLLNQKLKQQKEIVANAEKALKQMDDNGVRKSSTAYQDMQRKLIEATSAMMDTQDQLESLGTKAEGTAEKADKLSNSLGGLNKKVSLDQVSAGIEKITGGLENAAKKAVELGTQLWDTIMDSAKRADDSATMAQMYEVPLEKYLAMQALVGAGMDTTVDALLAGQQKFVKNVGNGSEELMGIMKELGLTTQKTINTGFGLVQETGLVSEDSLDLMFRAGQALMNMSDAYDQEAAAQKLFGKSWREMIPLFESYKTVDEYNKALEDQTTNSEESIRNLAELNDAVGKLEQSWTILKDEMLGAVAPALTKGAEAVSGLLDKLTEYLQTEKGQEFLEKLGSAVSNLFDDITKIDPAAAVQTFESVLTGITDTLKWISDNKDTVVHALEGIVIGWGALQLTGGVLEIVKIVNGLQTLSASSAAAAGTAAGSSWGAAFGAAVMKAAPFLAFLYTLLNPSGSAGNESDLVYNNGHVTQAGLDFWNNNPEQWDERLIAAGNRYGNISELMGNEQALGIMLNPSIDDEEMFRQLEELGVAVPVEPKVPDNTAEALSEQIGTVVVNGIVNWVDSSGNVIGMDTGLVEGPIFHKDRRPKRPKANGIWSVPFDGYTAVLHRGERVVPAREVAASRNFSSNLYVESMIMNNGTDANGLAAAIAERARQTMKSYGS